MKFNFSFDLWLQYVSRKASKDVIILAFFSENTKMQYTNMDRQHLYLRYNQSTQFSLAKSYAFNTNKVVCQDRKILPRREMVYYNKASITPLIDPPQPQHRQFSPPVCANIYVTTAASRVYSARSLRPVVDCSDHLGV